MLDVELKEVTKHEHALLEKQFIERIRGVRNHADYGALLIRIYGYYVEIEKKLAQTLASSSDVEYSSRLKHHLLERDLSTCNVTVGDFPVCNELPQVNSYPSALGALYVLEGSTLGGRIIAKMIGKNLGDDQALSFFTCYGEETETMWCRFKELLKHPFSDSERKEVVSAAFETFKTFRNWLSTQ